MTKTLDHPGKLGVWTWPDGFKAPEATEFARRLEKWGYSAWWIPEAVGRDPFALIGYLAGQTERLIYATGIANIYARDAITTKAIKKTLAEMLPGRFILGLGVSHPHLVTRLRGHAWEKPVPKMRQCPRSGGGGALHGPRARGRGADRDRRAAAAHARARARQDARRPSLPHHARAHPPGPRDPRPGTVAVPRADAGARDRRRGARARWRAPTSRPTCALPNYQESLKELGFTEQDFAGGGSDALVDALVGWGDEQALRDRIEAHWKAGADHVCIQPYRPDGKPGIDQRALEALAPAS